MSAVTRRPHIKISRQRHAVLHIVKDGRAYDIPIVVAEKYEVTNLKKAAPLDVFANLEKKYTKAGALLRGTRHRENLTQVQMAKRIHVTQADLSKMESGKRSIGKAIAKRIEEEFGVNYRYFLE